MPLWLWILISPAAAQITALRGVLNLPSARVAAAGLPVKCGLADVLYVKEQWQTFTPQVQSALENFVSRPNLPLSYLSPSGRFRLHYTLEGIDAVEPTSTNADGVPDFVYEAAIAADRAYDLLVGKYGFNAHLDDGGIDGPEFDIYFVDTSSFFGENYYGATIPETPAGTAYATYIAVENDFRENFYTRGLDAVRVTIAHEYFHAVHFTYNFRNQDIFFYEWSSTWFEDEAYPEINDYLQYVPQFFRTLHQPLHQRDGWHEYGAALFLKYWLSLHQPASLQRMWQGLLTQPALQAIEAEIEARGSSFAEALSEFAGWCLFTGPRAREGSYFPDAALFPEVTYRKQFAVVNDTSLTDSTRALGIRYYRISTDATRNFNAQVISAFPEKLGLTGASEAATGLLGPFVARVGSFPYALPANQNDGLVLLAVANGETPVDPSMLPAQLAHRAYSLQISLRVLEPMPAGLLEPRPNPFVLGQHRRAAVLYNLEQEAIVTLAIFSESGKIVLEKSLSRRPAGISQFVWNGRDDHGRFVASGVYLIVLRTSRGETFVRKLALIR